jgi:hypothetical protein
MSIQGNFGLMPSTAELASWERAANIKYGPQAVEEYKQVSLERLETNIDAHFAKMQDSATKKRQTQKHNLLKDLRNAFKGLSKDSREGRVSHSPCDRP